VKFSANLGFLWADRPLPDAIDAAAAAGFDAVELHWPYEVPAADIAAALRRTGLACLSLNTRRGDVAAGEFGLSALPGRDAEARAAIDEALAYAAGTGTRHVHVMAGVADGPDADATFRANLAYACKAAARHGIGILIEPLNLHDAPGYFLASTAHAVSVMDAVGDDALRLMFDCYHVQRMEGDVSRRLGALLPRTGHVQIAAVPDRGPPDHGELDYGHVLAVLARLGYDRPVGAEYVPRGDTDDTVSWMRRYR
jgi:hydroxypyruvate isomerase